VALLQQMLTDLDYWLGSADGVFGIRTEHAVTALQKAAGLDRTGVVGPETWTALEAGTRPTAHSSSGRVLEVDLGKQLLLLVQDGRIVKVFDVSTGRQGFRTPKGTFTIYREVDGWHDSGWGSVWRPKYYYEPTALAFHGYKSVPPYPASHGCVRLINPAIDWLWDHGNVPQGTTVQIY
jgi:lipoprotein-anchoring transpeptidase ErfK/SrfK